MLKIIACYAKTEREEWQKVHGHFYPGKEGKIYAIEAVWLYHGD